MRQVPEKEKGRSWTSAGTRRQRKRDGQDRGWNYERKVNMGNNEFIKRAVTIVTEYFNSNVDGTDGILLGPSDVFVVWSCKILQNNKALLSTDIPDGMYYEVTYNGDKKEFYLDAYKKWENILIPEGGSVR